MKKIVGLVVLLLLLTGCSATANINIDNNKISETITATGSSDEEYYKIKKLSSYPLTLYYDQKLQNPFDVKEKENGVKYYDIKYSSNSRMVIASGVFDFDNHVRSSMVRGCFKYYNIIKNGNIVTFSTSNGLICRYSNFKIVISSPYKVVNNNAMNVDSMNNRYTWIINNSNKNDINIQLDIDFSKKFNEKDNPDNSDNNNDNNSNISTIDNDYSKVILIVVAVIGLLIIIAYYHFRKIKKNNSSTYKGDF